MSFEIWRKNTQTKQWECIPVCDGWATQQTILSELTAVRTSLFTLAKAPVYGVVGDKITPWAVQEENCQVYTLSNAYGGRDQLVNVADSQIDGSLKLYWMLTNGG